MEVLNLIFGYFGGGKTPLHKPYPYSWNMTVRIFSLHFRYLPEMFGDHGLAENVNKNVYQVIQVVTFVSPSYVGLVN